MLEVELETRLGELHLDLSLELEPGRRLALVGPSGAGKTSLLRAVSGLLRPDRGLISCGGVAWLDTGAGIELAPEQRRCGYVFQDYALFGHMSAWRNVAYGLDYLPRSERRRAALELLDGFGVAALAEARPRTLSGGERQRVALARALGSRPRALLLDEPLAALDASTRARAAREMGAAVAEAGVPTLLVTHDFAGAVTLADEVAVIESGRIVQRGSPETLAAEPASPFVAEVTGASVLVGTGSRHPSGLTEVVLEGGGVVRSTDQTPPGPVTVSVHPWEIALEPEATLAHGSQQNRLAAMVRSVATIGSRVRVGLDAGQPLVAEITPIARDELGVEPGRRMVAVWKAAATRVIAR